MSATAQTHAARAMAYAFARNVASMQAAYIEWTRGDGADHGMAWISNTLCGPGLLPDAGSATAQEFFDCEMEKLDKLYPDVTMNPALPSPAWCASVDAELAATADADARLALPVWMPIANAPKEVELLGWRDDCGPLLIMHTSYDRFASDAECDEIDEETLFQKDWFGAGIPGGFERLQGSEQPAYWMPIPADPIGIKGPEITLPATAVAEGAQLDGESLEQAE